MFWHVLGGEDRQFFFSSFSFFSTRGHCRRLCSLLRPTSPARAGPATQTARPGSVHRTCRGDPLRPCGAGGRGGSWPPARGKREKRPRAKKTPLPPPTTTAFASAASGEATGKREPFYCYCSRETWRLPRWSPSRAPRPGLLLLGGGERERNGREERRVSWSEGGCELEKKGRREERERRQQRSLSSGRRRSFLSSAAQQMTTTLPQRRCARHSCAGVCPVELEVFLLFFSSRT